MAQGKDISNKTLASLVLVSITVFILGTFISFLSGPSGGPTGFVVINLTNTNGTTGFIVNGTIYLNLTDGDIELGNIELGVTKQSEDMVAADVNGRKDGNATGTLGDFFNVSNEGSAYINVSVYATGASPFKSPTGGANTLPNSYYQVHGNFSNSGNATGTINTAFVNVTYGKVPTSLANRMKVLMYMDHTEANNTGLIGVKVTIPEDEQAGEKNSTMVIFAEQQPDKK